MLLQNNTKTTFMHENIVFKAGEIKEIPKKIAELWLKAKGVVEYVDPKEVREAAAKAADAYKALKAEFDKLQEAYNALKKELAKLKENKTSKSNKTKKK